MIEAATFRRYQDADHDAVWSVFADCSAQLGFAVGPWDQDMHTIPDAYLRDGEFLVGQIEGDIIAFGGFKREPGPRGHVRRIAVHPSVQRRGIGRALMEELAARARAMGITVLYLDTSITQIAAQKLYLSCGYEETGHIVQSGVECIVYQKSIGKAT